MLHVTKRLAMEASNISHTIAIGRIKGATRNWVDQRLAVHRRLLELLELVLLTAVLGAQPSHVLLVLHLLQGGGLLDHEVNLFFCSAVNAIVNGNAVLE